MPIMFVRKALDGSTPIIISDGPLRACVQFTVQISDASSLQLLVSLDAESPYVRFDLKVNTSTYMYMEYHL